MAADFIVAAILLAAAIVVDWRMAYHDLDPANSTGLSYSGAEKSWVLESKCGDDAADMTSLFVGCVKGIPAEGLCPKVRLSIAGSRQRCRTSRRGSKTASRNKALVLSAYSFTAGLTFVVMAAGGIMLMLVLRFYIRPAIGFIVASVSSQAVLRHGVTLDELPQGEDSFARIRKIVYAPAVPERRPCAFIALDVEF